MRDRNSDDESVIVKAIARARELEKELERERERNAERRIQASERQVTQGDKLREKIREIKTHCDKWWVERGCKKEERKML